VGFFDSQPATNSLLWLLILLVLLEIGFGSAEHKKKKKFDGAAFSCKLMLWSGAFLDLDGPSNTYTVLNWGHLNLCKFKLI